MFKGLRVCGLGLKGLRVSGCGPQKVGTWVSEDLR